MTTVAYKNKVMVADTRITGDRGKFGEAVKIWKLSKGTLFGMAGDFDPRGVLKLVNSIETSEDIPESSAFADLKISISGLIVLPDGAIWSVDIDQRDDKEWMSYVFEVTSEFAAIGSGSPWALAAMAAGASSTRAVEIACHYDSGSSPPYNTLKL